MYLVFYKWCFMSALLGDNQDNILYGDDDANFIMGKEGNDKIYAGGGGGSDSDGNDYILSGDGQNTLYGNDGDDYLYGRANADLFLEKGDLIGDFELGIDVLNLAVLGIQAEHVTISSFSNGYMVDIDTDVHQLSIGLRTGNSTVAVSASDIIFKA